MPVDRLSFRDSSLQRICSDEGLNVALALGVIVKGYSPVLVAEGLEEGAEGLVEDTAEAHPELVEVPSDNPGGGEES